MTTHRKIAVLGGGGRTGKYLVTQLLSRDYTVRLLLRNPENFQIKNPRVEIVKGDALEINAVRSLTEGCSAVISTIGQRKDEPLVASQATLNVLNAMAEHNIHRYILVAGLNVDTPYDKKGSETQVATEWMKTTFPRIHEDRQKSYSILATSNVNWTLVRVPMIAYSDIHGKILVSLEDCPGNKISASDIAAFIIAQLDDDTFGGKAPFIANG